MESYDIKGKQLMHTFLLSLVILGIFLFLLYIIFMICEINVVYSAKKALIISLKKDELFIRKAKQYCMYCHSLDEFLDIINDHLRNFSFCQKKAILKIINQSSELGRISYLYSLMDSVILRREK